MKCPKCGYTSFDHLYDCAKCGKDLAVYKSRFNLRGPLLAAFGGSCAFESPPAYPQEKIENPIAAASPFSPGEATDFGYDFMAEEKSGAGGHSPEETSDLFEKTEDDFSFEEMEDSLDLDIPERESPPDPAVAAEIGAEESGAEENDQFLDLELDLSWDENPTPVAGMPTLAAAASGSDEIDLPSLEDLPPLDDEISPEAKTTEVVIEELSDLLDFAELEEGIRPAEEKDGPPDEGDRRRPFDYRESAEAEQAPGSTEEENPHLPTGKTGQRGSESAPASCVAEEIYSLPESDEITFLREDNEDLPAAPVRARLTAGIADGLILLAVFSIFITAGNYALGTSERLFSIPSAPVLPSLLIPYFLLLFFLCLGYFTFCHFLTGQTVGKMLLRLRVETEEGSPLLFSQAFLRSTGGFLCLLPAGWGFLRLLAGGEDRSWNDRLAGTRVVSLGPAEISPERNT